MDEKKRPDPDQLTGLEKFYENFRKIPLKYVDLFIGACIAALVLVVAAGIWNR